MQSSSYMFYSSIVPLAIVIIGLSGCGNDPLVAFDDSAELSAEVAPGPNAAPVPDVEGNWLWEESVELTGPSDLVMFLFGIAEAEGPVMRVSCLTGGALQLSQNGAEFTGQATQSAECETKGGQTASQTPFPPAFEIEGDVKGHSIQFEALVGEGFHCPYRGSLTIDGGTATAFNTTGRCDTPLEVNPNVTKSIYFRATRL